MAMSICHARSAGVCLLGTERIDGQEECEIGRLLTPDRHPARRLQPRMSSEGFVRVPSHPDVNARLLTAQPHEYESGERLGEAGGAANDARRPTYGPIDARIALARPLGSPATPRERRDRALHRA